MYNIRTMNENTLPTMTDEERNEFLEIINTDVEKPMALLDGFEDCLLYYMEDENGNPHAVYCYEDLVESFIKKAGFKKGVNYFKEMYIHEITQKWGINLSAISNQGKMEKRFDYVVKTDKQIYVIETNFYGSGGSKLNETARSYKTLAQEVATIDGLTFIWFTDGSGWRSARNNLEETFDVMENIYCIADMENRVMEEIFK